MFVDVHELHAPIRSLRVHKPAPHFGVNLGEPFTLAHLEDDITSCIHKTFNVTLPLRTVNGIVLTPDVNLRDLRDGSGVAHVFCPAADLAGMLHLDHLATFSLIRQAEYVISQVYGKVQGTD
jgi:hypothetical protein